MAEKRDPEVAAVQVVYTALKGLDSDDARRKVLSSVLALLGITDSTSTASVSAPTRGRSEAPLATTGRPVSLIELMQEKQPGTNGQRIAVFAYHREKNEGIQRFSRDDLKPYFAKAKLPPSGNYDRDFVEAVRKGWIHEDGSDSYLTSKGVEAVESGFQGERKYTKPTGAAARSRRGSGKGRRRGTTRK